MRATKNLKESAILSHTSYTFAKTSIKVLINTYTTMKELLS